MSNEFWDEVFRLVNNYDQQRPVIVKEFRLYYDPNGSVIGLWENDHPAGNNYIVLDDPDIYHRHNTNYLKVVNEKLTVLDPKQSSRAKLIKSDSGIRVIKGKASLPLYESEQAEEVEYYDRTNN